MEGQNQPDSPITIGPLTAEEWASLFLPGDDDRNPLPPCCGNISDVRSALADVMRMGGDTRLGALRLVPVWDYVDQCLGGEYVLAQPVMRKLYDTYICDQEIPERFDEAYEQFRALTAEQVSKYLHTVTGPGSLFDLDTPAGRMHALVRMAGAFVAFLVDDTERQEAAEILALEVGVTEEMACFAVDVLRQEHGLPHRPTWHLNRGEETDRTTR